MIDIVLEISRSLYVAAIFIFLVVAGRKEGLKKQNGWYLILSGFGLILFGMVIDITDNFPELNKYVVIGDTVVEAFIEKVVGHLVGFFLLGIGFWKLMPAIVRLQETETRLMASHRNLEREILERKQAEAELKKTKNAAEAANMAKSRFLAQMSHEIRTPLNGVLGMAELLQGTELNPQQKRLAQTIHQSGEVLLHIINEILDFSKIEAGKLELEVIDFNLPRTIEETIDLMAERAHAKNLEISCLLDPKLPTEVRGDPRRLYQILWNLVGNAIKFTGAGEVIVSVRPFEIHEDSMLVHFSVQDTGIGIPPALQADIFEPFSQGDNSTTRKYGGTGLGLTIVKQLVEIMHGEIGLFSEPGQGSTFWFTIKLEKPANGRQSAKPQTPEKLPRLRLVVAEPNDIQWKNMNRQFASLGLKPDWVASGMLLQEMLRAAAIRGKPYDLAMISVSLPDIPGLKLAELIKADPAIARVKLVLLTSFSHSRSAPLEEESGLADYLNKPLSPSKLYRCITSTMEKDKPGARLPIVQTPLANRGDRFYGCVLLAEDNPVNIEVARGMLEKLGCQVDVAKTGLEAVQIISSSQYDAILMDCQMPEMDGYEATRLIRTSEKIGSLTAAGDGLSAVRTPIIALTAHTLEGDREKCLAAGMDDYLGKPFSLEQLTTVLGRWLPPETEAELCSQPFSKELFKEEV